MAEETLAAPLSGQEVIEAILFKVREMLQKDCFLSPMAGYESFSASIQVQVKLQDTGREVAVNVDVKEEAEQPFVGNDDIHLEQAEAEMDIKPPNEVRLESGQPIPALIRDASGKEEIKPLRYKRKET